MPWPDAARPGLPADPNRPWHWLAEAGGHPLPVGWNPHLRHWVLWDRSTIEPEEAARRFSYLGPALTPAESEAATAEAVAAAAPATPPPAEEPRGLAALAASSQPDPPPAMVYKKDAIRNHILIFVGTLVATVFLIEKFGIMG
jgi:hypothetical protein